MSGRLALYGGGAALGLLLLGGGPVAWLWFRPGLVRAVAVGWWLALLVTVPWSLMASLAVGPSGPLGLTGRDVGGSYARLLAGPSGNAAEFGAVTGGLVVSCCVLAGWRSRRRTAPAGPPGMPGPPAVAASPRSSSEVARR